jgi:hypothetical protein
MLLSLFESFPGVNLSFDGVGSFSFLSLLLKMLVLIVSKFAT